jgi:hypothetical protein
MMPYVGAKKEDSERLYDILDTLGDVVEDAQKFIENGEVTLTVNLCSHGNVDGVHIKTDTHMTTAMESEVLRQILFGLTAELGDKLGQLVKEHDGGMFVVGAVTHVFHEGMSPLLLAKATNTLADGDSDRAREMLDRYFEGAQDTYMDVA